ncbi:MAG: hypothetical protein JW981_06935 [Anaerolineae bacterium]|nr:hypothetical protein [Anaerolineae bacterium]
MEIYYKGELLGYIEANPVQDTFPWYAGRVVPTEAMDKYLEFLGWYEGVCEFPYHPFEQEVYEYYNCDDAQYPRDDEERYKKSDLFSYVQFLKALQAGFRDGNSSAVIQECLENERWDIQEWVERWQSQPYDAEQFAAYIEFLDYRNWKVIDDGQEVAWLPYPPEFSVKTMAIFWR